MLTRLLLISALVLPAPAHAADIAWQPWSTAFAQARTEHKRVFLYLEAVWCHWCHVMQKQTFPDEGVRALLARDFISVRVDHDADPLLASRYRDHGWPALVVLDAEGRDLDKQAGFLDAGDFSRWLASAREPPAGAPSAGAPKAGPAQLTARGRELLRRKHVQTHDDDLGGLKLPQKFMDRDAVEYDLQHRNRPGSRRRALQTLDAARALMDPAWGGVYQYSTHGDWRHPHYEKIMRTQAAYLRIYALAWAALKRPRDLQAARAIRDYLFAFLRSPEGAFYASQDADLVQGVKAHDYFALDDADRRQRGIPRVDKNLYAQENGWAIEALATLAQVSDDREALTAARRAAEWALKHRRLDDDGGGDPRGIRAASPHMGSLPGGFRHGERDAGGPYLGDTLAMARGFLALHRASGEALWLQHALDAARFITAHFSTAAGYAAARGSQTVDVEENIAAARLFAALARVSDDRRWRLAAERAMSALTDEGFIASRYAEAGILLADEALAALDSGVR